MTTLDALEIILAAPLWPKRDELGAAGRALFDELVADAKPYSLAIAAGDFSAALNMAAGWAPLVNAMMDGERIAEDEANERLLRVFQYYSAQVADISRVDVKKAVDNRRGVA